jgi:hypothetical protein
LLEEFLVALQDPFNSAHFHSQIFTSKWDKEDNASRWMNTFSPIRVAGLKEVAQMSPHLISLDIW